MAVPSPSPSPDSGGRPRPVLIYGALVAGLTALLGTAGLTEIFPPRAVLIMNISLVVLVAVGGALFTQGQVTPLSSPQAADGRPLVPAPPAVVPPGTPPAALDAEHEPTQPLVLRDRDQEPPIWRRHGAP